MSSGSSPSILNRDPYVHCNNCSLSTQSEGSESYYMKSLIELFCDALFLLLYSCLHPNNCFSAFAFSVFKDISCSYLKSVIIFNYNNYLTRIFSCLSVICLISSH